MFDYISVLAGGRCSFDCDFCVGKNIRKDEPPHFAKNWKEFINYFYKETEWISISGSTSDPMLVGYNKLLKIINHSKDRGLKVSLHTRSTNYKLGMLNTMVNELVISVDRPTESNVKFFKSLPYKDRVRISAVCTSGNRYLFENNRFFQSFPVRRFTIRMNVFEPELEYPHIPYPQINKNDFGALWFGNDEKHIALWDFRKTNKKINALYLWPDGNVNEQCYWFGLYNKDK